MASPSDPSPEGRVGSLYEQLLNSWNCRDANGFAALFAETGEAVGFDGSQLVGRQDIAASLRHIFAGHQTPAYVSIVRTIRFPGPDVAVLRATVGMVPHGQGDIDPSLNAIQIMVAARSPAGWRIEALQNTPARFHGRPELADALTAELRQRLPRP